MLTIIPPAQHSGRLRLNADVKKCSKQCVRPIANDPTVLSVAAGEVAQLQHRLRREVPEELVMVVRTCWVGLTSIPREACMLGITGLLPRTPHCHIHDEFISESDIPPSSSSSSSSSPESQGPRSPDFFPQHLGVFLNVPWLALPLWA